VDGGGASCVRSGGGGKAVGMVKRQQPWSEHGRHKWRRCSDWVADRWAPAILDFFYLCKTSSTLKMKMGDLSSSKNSQFVHVASIGYYEQFSRLCRHPIPNRNRAKNHGLDSSFEFLKNFKRDLNLLEKSSKFSKFFLDLIFTKVNLVGITYMQEFELQYNCQMTWFEKNKRV
jgi:hypothetical protein